MLKKQVRSLKSPAAVEVAILGREEEEMREQWAAHKKTLAQQEALRAGKQLASTREDFEFAVDTLINALVGKGVLQLSDIPQKLQDLLSLRKKLRDIING